MHTLQQLTRLVLPTLLVIFLAGCELFGSSDPEPGMVTLQIANRVNSQDVVLNQQNYMSAAGHSYNVSLIEYILTDIVLLGEDGSQVTLAASQYVNEENAGTKTLAPVELPAGDYRSIQFTFGVKGDDNVFGNLERSTDYDNMMWPMMMPMGDGATERYHYMRFEGRYGTDGTFRIHTGPTGGNDNSFDVTLPLGISVDGQEWTIGVSMNLDQWLTGPNDWDFANYGMIMGNQAAQTLIYDNGHSVFTLGFTDID